MKIAYVHYFQCSMQEEGKKSEIKKYKKNLNRKERRVVQENE